MPASQREDSAEVCSVQERYWGRQQAQALPGQGAPAGALTPGGSPVL